MVKELCKGKWIGIMIFEDESIVISREQSKRARDERLASERGMIRLFTATEEDILRKGLKDGEVKEEN
jgi:hypothetical protein